MVFLLSLCFNRFLRVLNIYRSEEGGGSCNNELIGHFECNGNIYIYIYI